MIPGWGTKIPHNTAQLSPRATTREPKCCNKDLMQPNKQINKRNLDTEKQTHREVRTGRNWRDAPANLGLSDSHRKLERGRKNIFFLEPLEVA